MRFIVDAQLPPALARFIEARGHEAKHVLELGIETESDQRIWQVALEGDAVIITKDEDFIRLRSVRASGPAIVWVRLGNTTRDALLRVFAEKFSDVVGALEAGEPVIEFRAS